MTNVQVNEALFGFEHPEEDFWSPREMLGTYGLYTVSLDACWRIEAKLFELCKEHGFQNDYEGRLVDASLDACTADVGCAKDDCGPWWHRTMACYPARVRAHALAEVIVERRLEEP